MSGSPQSPRSSGQKPGAMTMAMKAVQSVQGPKVLRIGVIQGGKIIDERVIRNRDTVSVGTTEKNTFTIAAPEFPAHYELFQAQDGVYRLNFTEGMEGRVALPDGVQSLAQLRSSGKAQRGGVGWQVTLQESARGKISVGEVSFLFQFVNPPPPQPKPQLPAAIRATWTKNVDWVYNACLAFFMVCAFSGIAYVEYLYDPEIEDQFSLDARTVALAMPPQIEEPPPEQPHEQETQEAANAQAPTQTAAQHHTSTSSSSNSAAAQTARAERAEASANRAAAAADRAAAAAMAAAEAQFTALTAATSNGGPSATDSLRDGAVGSTSLAVLQNSSGVGANGSRTGIRGGALATAGPGSGTGTLTGPRTSTSTTASSMGTSASSVGSAPQGRSSVSGGSVTGGEGELNAGAVASAIRGANGRFQACYNLELRSNPSLSGRLSVNLTIGAAGRATSVSTSGMGGGVGSCVASAVRALSFPRPTGGDVRFSFSLNFSPGG